MVAARIVRLTRDGPDQVLHIPQDLEFTGSEVKMHRDGDRLILEPNRPGTLLDLLDTMEAIDEDFPAIEDLPYRPVDL